MDRLLLVSLAGAVGSGCRYLVAISLPRLLGTSFPWGTLAVNLVGCFVIAVVGNLAPLTPTTKLIIGTGFCGGFTTYSAFNFETMKLVEQRAYGVAIAYVLATLVGCALFGALGWLSARALVAD